MCKKGGRGVPSFCAKCDFCSFCVKSNLAIFWPITSAIILDSQKSPCDNFVLAKSRLVK